MTHIPRIAYKLVRKLKNGSLAPLFIDKTSRFSIGKWMKAKDIPTKGFAFRPGFHATVTPFAPHLSTKGRVWCKIEIKNYTTYERPVHQGGTWFTAKNMKIIEICH